MPYVRSYRVTLLWDGKWQEVCKGEGTDETLALCKQVDHKYSAEVRKRLRQGIKQATIQGSRQYDPRYERLHLDKSTNKHFTVRVWLL